MKITRCLTIISVLMYSSVMQCPVVEFKPETVKADFAKFTEKASDAEVSKWFNDSMARNPRAVGDAFKDLLQDRNVQEKAQKVLQTGINSFVGKESSTFTKETLKTVSSYIAMVSDPSTFGQMELRLPDNSPARPSRVLPQLAETYVRLIEKANNESRKTLIQELDTLVTAATKITDKGLSNNSFVEQDKAADFAKNILKSSMHASLDNPGTLLQLAHRVIHAYSDVQGNFDLKKTVESIKAVTDTLTKIYASGTNLTTAHLKDLQAINEKINTLTRIPENIKKTIQAQISLLAVLKGQHFEKIDVCLLIGQALGTEAHQENRNFIDTFLTDKNPLLKPEVLRGFAENTINLTNNDPQKIIDVITTLTNHIEKFHEDKTQNKRASSIIAQLTVALLSKVPDTVFATFTPAQFKSYQEGWKTSIIRSDLSKEARTQALQNLNTVISNLTNAKGSKSKALINNIVTLAIGLLDTQLGYNAAGYNISPDIIFKNITQLLKEANADTVITTVMLLKEIAQKSTAKKYQQQIETMISKTPAILDIFATTKPEIVASLVAPATVDFIIKNLKTGFDNAIKNPLKQQQALAAVDTIITFCWEQFANKNSKLHSEALMLLSTTLEYLTKSGQGLALANMPEVYNMRPLSIDLSSMIFKSAIDVINTASLDPKLIQQFNDQLIAYAQAIQIEKPGDNTSEWSTKENITLALNDLIRTGKIILTEPLKTLMLQAAFNFIKGASFIRASDGKLDLWEFYKNPSQKGSEWGRYEIVGFVEESLLTLSSKKEFNETDFKMLQSFKKDTIAPLKDMLEDDDKFNENFQKAQPSQKAEYQETRITTINALNGFDARIDIFEAFKNKNYNEVADKLKTALSEFPVFGVVEHFSFAHDFINKMLPEMLPAMDQKQAATIITILLRPEMQVQLPREDYVTLMTSKQVIDLIQKAGVDATKPLLENLDSMLNSPQIFNQKTLFNKQHVETLKTFIRKFL